MIDYLYWRVEWLRVCHLELKHNWEKMPAAQRWYTGGRMEQMEKALKDARAVLPNPLGDEIRFINHLMIHWDDVATRTVYSDWLLDQDRVEESDRQRSWSESWEWLKEWTKRINYSEYARNEDGTEKTDTSGDCVVLGKSETDPHTVYDVMEAGYIISTGGEYCFGSDAGAEYFRGSEHSYREFMRHWAIVTGMPVEVDWDQPANVRCAC